MAAEPAPARGAAAGVAGGLSVVLAAGGTAGHIEPALNLADAVRGAVPAARVTVVGTAAGLEQRLVPGRGYPLATIPKVALPRRLTPALLTLPGRLAAAVRAAGAVLTDTRADVVVGFGGYAALPVYLAARRAGVPLVVHEANARPGLANRVGARLTRHVAVTVAGTALPHATVTGVPLRPAVLAMPRDPAGRAAARAAARDRLGLTADGPAVLVTGGSQGAQRINAAALGAASALHAAGVQVLHVAGPANAAAVRAAVPPEAAATHQVRDYLDDMSLAYAAVDLAVCRAGMLTCAELAAVGLPAVYVPLPIGNGEQQRNAAPTVAAGGGVLLLDARCTAESLAGLVLPLLADPTRLALMAAAAGTAPTADRDGALLALTLRAAGWSGAAGGGASGGADGGADRGAAGGHAGEDGAAPPGSGGAPPPAQPTMPS